MQIKDEVLFLLNCEAPVLRSEDEKLLVKNHNSRIFSTRKFDKIEVCFLLNCK